MVWSLPIKSIRTLSNIFWYFSDLRHKFLLLGEESTHLRMSLNYWSSIQPTSATDMLVSPVRWHSSFSVIGFRFYRFCRLHRITGELRKSSSKMLSPLGSEPRASAVTAQHAIIWDNSPIFWKSQPFRSLCSHALFIPELRNFLEHFATESIESRANYGKLDLISMARKVWSHWN